MNVLNHKILGRNLLKIFYRSLNANNKVVIETNIGRTFTSFFCEVAKEILDQISKTNQGCNTRDAESWASTYTIKASNE